jgi:hypothetical protein
LRLTHAHPHSATALALVLILALAHAMFHLHMALTHATHPLLHLHLARLCLALGLGRLLHLLRLSTSRRNQQSGCHRHDLQHDDLLSRSHWDTAGF